MFPFRRFHRGRFGLPPFRRMQQAMESCPDQPLRQMLAAKRQGRLIDPISGDPLTVTTESISVAEMALVHHLAKSAPAGPSVEVGFGWGMSTAAIMAARSGPHVTIDPFMLAGLGEAGLAIVTRDGHTHYRERSQFVLPRLVATWRGTCPFIFIDGGHSFEDVMTDFVFADMLVAPGGLILLDDATHPAIETVVRYVHANRADYDIADLAVDGISVLRKTREVRRNWYHFRPFSSPLRWNWLRRL